MGRGDQVESSNSYWTEPMLVKFFENQGLFINKIKCGGYQTFAEAYKYW